MGNHGFVIVRRASADQRHPAYEGLDRVPPWTLDVADALDVGELGRLEDELGLVPSPEAADRALDIYSRVWPRAELEVLWADACTKVHPVPQPGVELGYDVATGPPFYSIVHDMPASVPELASFRAQLNEARLFPNRVQAERYLLAYRAAHERDQGLEDPEGQQVWRVLRRRL